MHAAHTNLEKSRIRPSQEEAMRHLIDIVSNLKGKIDDCLKQIQNQNGTIQRLDQLLAESQTKSSKPITRSNKGHTDVITNQERENLTNVKAQKKSNKPSDRVIENNKQKKQVDKEGNTVQDKKPETSQSLNQRNDEKEKDIRTKVAKKSKQDRRP
ncbi:hypothetical protein TcasGA2_TC032282 [Tribolium castaneum]|uniref:Uncharacterized protein n=1 Tax=Tribolium castaneum TaxID=7070 RepID=A0A139W9Z7_TRICA|nr:hypothetical protein TcasGA2_TC032282 [Tribolium castaneum]